MAVQRIAINGVVRQQWSNGTQAGDPASGYTEWNAQGIQTLQRALTTDESATLAATDLDNSQSANGATLKQRAQTALTANTTFLALASPTNAQTLAQVQLLTKECNGLIRLALGLLDSTAGT